MVARKIPGQPPPPPPPPPPRPSPSPPPERVIIIIIYYLFGVKGDWNLVCAHYIKGEFAIWSEYHFKPYSRPPINIYQSSWQGAKILIDLGGNKLYGKNKNWACLLYIHQKQNRFKEYITSLTRQWCLYQCEVFSLGITLDIHEHFDLQSLLFLCLSWIVEPKQCI